MLLILVGVESWSNGRFRFSLNSRLARPMASPRPRPVARPQQASTPSKALPKRPPAPSSKQAAAELDSTGGSAAADITPLKADYKPVGSPAPAKPGGLTTAGDERVPDFLRNL